MERVSQTYHSADQCGYCIFRGSVLILKVPSPSRYNQNQNLDPDWDLQTEQDVSAKILLSIQLPWLLNIANEARGKSSDYVEAQLLNYWWTANSPSRPLVQPTWSRAQNHTVQLHLRHPSSVVDVTWEDILFRDTREDLDRTNGGWIA